MSFKKSFQSVEKNSTIWKNQLTIFKTSLVMPRKIQNIDFGLNHFSKMPTKEIIIGRYNSLAQSQKYKSNRIKTITNEICDLWKNMNLPTVSVRSVNRKIENLISLYHKSIKRPKDCDDLKNVFDVTKINSDFHSEYSPSIQRDFRSISSCDFDENYLSEESESYIPPARLKPKLSTTHPAVTLVNKVHISTKKAAKICKELSDSGVTISTPSQPAIYKAVIKSAEQKEKQLKEQLKEELWCLHFDGKRIKGKEIQVIVLKNESKEIYLGVLVLNDGKANTIFNGIRELLYKFDLWNNIKMIICDTTSVNTGKINGVVTQLQKFCKSLRLEIPQYIGCQHHILDLILRHVMDELLGGKTSSPDICYSFVRELISNYNNLKQSYIQNSEMLDITNIKWRDDMQYLFELGTAFRFFQETKKFPYIKFKPIPPISNARWNSRAILAILAYILIQKYQNELYPICEFICGKWFDIWFSDQTFRDDNFEVLYQSLSRFEAAKNCFIKHWKKDDSIIRNQQRSNICAERAIKVVQDIYPFCKSPRTLNLKFLSFNN